MFTEGTLGTSHMKIIMLLPLLVLELVFFTNNKAFGQQATNQWDIKFEIVSIQGKIGDLTDSMEPFRCKEFVLLRKSMSTEAGKQIVLLIKDHQLTTLQSEIGLCLLSGLAETNYWETTKPLLSTNTSEEVLYNILGMPMPYGPCFANAYTNEKYRAVLMQLKADTTSKMIKMSLDFILSGEAANTYRDYLKHPARYGYAPAQVPDKP
jgi:hypothetical protein